MTERPVLTPSSEHPITIVAAAGRVRVHLGGALAADTDAALSLHESNYPVVHYIPLKDVMPGVLTRSDTVTYCPFKGEACYYHVNAPGGTVADGVWAYERPYPAVAAIAEHVAFDPGRVGISVAGS